MSIRNTISGFDKPFYGSVCLHNSSRLEHTKGKESSAM